ncbi:NAD(P)/FAD-dependent oxidoreductase [Rubrimonas cliftonensis]|uniref:Glycine/D-amino acid oxidase n=1 Tax=Rubrimonas cliftonensis TaxID=89524 RepID=A0A1H3VWU9_9RHOB|nr:FAD-binding oxidoreductase [Rubrimonas cliftonensis]SDZ79277.1 Glycine/D-amino acid oxidase [Rubrimonas cliftonensis]
MKGPLAPELYDVARPCESWWRETAAPGPALAPLEGDATVDVAVIGGGYAGLSTALRLAELGVSCAVLEAGEIGWGASGRNGGIVGLASDKLSHAARARRVGEAEAARAVAAQVEGAQRLRAFCAAQGVETQGEAEALVAHCPAAFAALADAPAVGGASLEILSREAYAERGYEGPEQHGAALMRPGFGVHPLQLVRAWARAAQAAGVAIHPFSEALRWRREGAAHRVETARGTLRAGRIVLATNGFTPDGLHPAFAARAMPVISMIGVTRPLTAEELSRHRWREDNPLANTRRMLFYWRMLPQRRLLFGMRGDLTGAEAAAPVWRARLAASLARAFPGWADIPLTHFWRGPICATRAYAPAVGRLPDDASVFHAFGWHGSGVNGAQTAGRLLAEAIVSGEEAAIPALWRGLPPRILLPGLRTLWLAGAIAGFRLADAMEARTPLRDRRARASVAAATR